MLAAKEQGPRKDYVVKYGYVYSDAHGNHYKAGQVVSLSQKEYDLSQHRVHPYVDKAQQEIEGAYRPPATVYGRPAHAKDVKLERPAPDPETPVTDSLLDLFGTGKYNVK